MDSVYKARILLDLVRSALIHEPGPESSGLWDLDYYFLGGVGDDFSEPGHAARRLDIVVDEMVPKLVETARQHSITRLAFLEKPYGGPVGMLALMSLIVKHAKMEACIIRPRKRLLMASLKGRPIIQGERVMIISDVATTGTALLQAARRLRELGAIVPAAFVYLDSAGEACNNLAAEGVALDSFLNLTSCGVDEAVRELLKS